MATAWRSDDDPAILPLVLIAHEDFVRSQSFSGSVGSLVTGTTVKLVFYAGSGVADPVIGTWPAETELSTAKSKWSVNSTQADAIPAGCFYRLWLSVPNASDTGNPTIERCLAMGKVSRK